MKTKIAILLLAICSTFLNLQAQRVVTTTRAMSYDISDNLDLEAVASIFGDSENLEDFERRLNDPDTRISNLDLNEDGYIDYLRVIENSSDRNSLVIIQAVLDENIFQDVASIEIERTNDGNHRIQVVGDAYLYGSNYIIEPVFVRRPLIFSFFWGPRYVAWNSPYYWHYYPNWYRYYRPYSPFKYHRHVHSHINRYNTYRYENERNSHFSGNNYNHVRRNDYASRYPDRSFEKRNQGSRNKYEMNQRRPDNVVNRQKSGDINRSNDRQIQNNRNSNTGRNERPRTINETRRQAPTNQSGASQNRTRGNNEVKSNNSSNRIQQNKASENRTINRPEAPRSQSTTKPVQERTRNRVEPTKKSAVKIERAPTKSAPARTRSEAKPSQKSNNKAVTSKKESKERSDRRRTE